MTNAERETIFIDLWKRCTPENCLRNDGRKKKAFQKCFIILERIQA